MVLRRVSTGPGVTAALAEIAQKLGKGGTVRVGFLEGARYPDGKPVAMIAAIQDFGAPAADIPPRPFFRNMVAKESPGWPDGVRTVLKATDYDVERTLEQVGEGIAGQLRQSIVDTNEPPLKPATVRRKGFDKPLVDTGTLLHSVDYEIEDEAGTYTTGTGPKL